MATNAYGQDFWVAQIWRSRDHREYYRHVQIHDLLSGRAKCLNYSVTLKKCLGRFTKISLKNLATRWELCTEKRPCSFCARGTVNAPEAGSGDSAVGEIVRP